MNIHTHTYTQVFVSIHTHLYTSVYWNPHTYIPTHSHKRDYRDLNKKKNKESKHSFRRHSWLCFCPLLFLYGFKESVFSHCFANCSSEHAISSVSLHISQQYCLRRRQNIALFDCAIIHLTTPFMNYLSIALVPALCKKKRNPTKPCSGSNRQGKERH